jgi:hypothetical protein
MPGPDGIPRKRTNAGVIVSVVLSIVVVAGLLIAGVLALSQSHNSAGTNGNTGGSFVNPNGNGTVTPGLSPVFNDPLTSNANGWVTSQNCFFKSDGFHEKTTNAAWACDAPTNVPDNFTAQVQVKQISGATNLPYGLDFRRSSTNAEYRFYIDGYGHWIILRCTSSTCSTLSNWTPSGAIQAGLNRENTLEVSASGSHFEFFANGQKIGQIVDSTYGSGTLALAVGGSNMEAVYTNLVINQIV